MTLTLGGSNNSRSVGVVEVFHRNDLSGFNLLLLLFALKREIRDIGGTENEDK
jgi:hypothetical protein